MKVQVTTIDILTGIGGDCHRCAVALALARASRDDEALVIDRPFHGVYLCARYRWIKAPYQVWQFVHAFDDLERHTNGKVIVPVPLGELEPFAFELPAFDDPAGDWQEECSGCQELRDPDELDEEGYCAECQGVTA